MSRERGRLHVDYSPDTGAVVACHDCPHWFAWRWTRVEAWEAARAHELRCHPGSMQATTALSYWKRSADGLSGAEHPDPVGDELLA